MREFIVGLLITLTVLMAAHTAYATHSGDEPLTLRYRNQTGQVLIVRGVGCFSQEDVTRLKLVEYESPDFVVYRCITP